MHNNDGMVKMQDFLPENRTSTGQKKKSAKFLPVKQIEEILLNINCRLEKENHLENRNHRDSSPT